MKKVVVMFGAALAPFIASAQVAQGVQNVSGLIAFLTNAFNIATGLILAAAVVFFLWGVLEFVMAAGEEEAREKGKGHIIYGIIGIAVMVSVWGLVNFLTSSARLTTTPVAPPALPTITG